MGWDGNGNFTRVHDWTDDEASAIDIEASRMDAEDDNFTTGINACLAKNGENTATQINCDNIRIDGNTISSQNTNGDINISPNGTGTVVVTTDLDVDNINVNGNTISSTDTNGDINLTPNGSGKTVITNAKFASPLIDDGDAGVTITSADQTNASATVTIPDIGDAADTFAMLDTTQTLTNKTLTSPTINTATYDGGTIGASTAITEFHCDNVDVDGGIITIGSTVPTILMEEAGVAADTGNWGLLTDSGVIQIRAYNDAYSAWEVALRISRTGATIDTVNFPNGTLQYGGAEVVNLSNSVTLTNKTLTSPTINTATIEGGTIGATTPVTEFHCDNIDINGNTISTTDTNGNFNISPDGAGQIVCSANIMSQEGTTPYFIIRDTDSTGSAVACYLSLRDSASTEVGLLGFTSAANTDFTVKNTLGDIELGPSTTGIAKITGTTTGNANLAYLRFNQSDGTRDGYIGSADGSSRDLEIFCDSGNIDLTPSGGKVRLADSAINRVRIDDYSITFQDHGNTGATETIDLTNGNVHEITLDQNTTLTFSNPPGSGTYGELRLIVIQDATGSRTITWPASVDWSGGSAPTLSAGASDVDILDFFTVDGGTTWYGIHTIVDAS